MTFAFFGSGEILIALVVGLLLFGGRLPEIVKQVAKFFGEAKRTMADIRRETGVDEVIRDIRSDVDRAAGPLRDREPGPTDELLPPTERESPKNTESDLPS